MYHLLARYTPDGRWCDLFAFHYYETANKCRAVCAKEAFPETRYVIVYKDKESS